MLIVYMSICACAFVCVLVCVVQLCVLVCVAQLCVLVCVVQLCVLVCLVQLCLTCGLIDIHECHTGEADCHPLRASCTNTHGSFICMCLENYTGDGVICDGEHCLKGTAAFGEHSSAM